MLCLYCPEGNDCEMKELPCIEVKNYIKYKEFYSSVACIVAEGSEFMTKSQMYDAIKKDLLKE